MNGYTKDEHLNYTGWSLYRSDGLIKRYVKKVNGDIEVRIIKRYESGASQIIEFRRNGIVLSREWRFPCEEYKYI